MIDRIEAPRPASSAVWDLVAGYGGAHRKRQPICMLEAYFDDSGTGQHPVHVVAGFLATAEKWAAFADDWQAELDKAPRLHGAFEMSEAMSRWRSPSLMQKRDALSGIISKHMSLAIVSTVDVAAHEELIQNSKEWYGGRSPYWLSLFGVMGATYNLAEGLGLRRKTKLVFDRTSLYKHIVEAYGYIVEDFPEISDVFAGTPSQGTDDLLLPLQATDWLVWQVRRFFFEEANPTAERKMLYVRGQVPSVMPAGFPVAGKQWTREAILKLREGLSRQLRLPSSLGEI